MKSLRICCRRVFCFPRSSALVSKNENDGDDNIACQAAENTSYLKNDDAEHLSSSCNLLFLATVNGDKAMLSKILSTCSDQNLEYYDSNGRTALIYSVLSERLEVSEMLLKTSIDVNKQDSLGRTALHWAAVKGNNNSIKQLLSHGASVMLKDNNGSTPLHLSTRHQSPKCLSTLIKQVQLGVVDDQDCNKRTALHIAASNGNLAQVRLLIKHDSNVGIPDIGGRTPLHWAASCNHGDAVGCIQTMLEASPSVINWQDYDGCTALHLAVAMGNVAVVQALVSLDKCNVSVLDNQFRTPLHWAAALGHSQMVLILLSNKADPSSSDSNGATPLHYAAQYNAIETVQVFTNHHGFKDDLDIEGRSAFMWACSYGANDVVRYMAQSSTDINVIDKWGASALHMASVAGHASTCELLLDLGIPVDVLDHSKHSALFGACQSGGIEVVQVLVDRGATMERRDEDGCCPLHWAALGGDDKICQLLIKRGLPVDLTDNAGRTALHCASYNGSVSCIVVLIEHKANVDAQDSDGMTSLHWACSQGHTEVIKLLIQSGARLNIMEFSEDRYTPLDYALMNEHQDISQHMIGQGALTFTYKQELAALQIQAWYRLVQVCYDLVDSYRCVRVRRTYLTRRELLMRHEEMLRCAARKKEKH